MFCGFQDKIWCKLWILTSASYLECIPLDRATNNDHFWLSILLVAVSRYALIYGT